MSLLSLLIIGVIILFILYCVISTKKRNAYFQNHNIPYLGSLLGKTLRLITGSLDMVKLEEEIYRDAKATGSKLVAMSDPFGQVTVYLTDLELIKNVTVKDFEHFVNLRDFRLQNSSRYFFRMLFAMRDEQWKGVRAKLTPAFTTGKIRKMVPIFQSSSKRMEAYVKKEMKNSEDMDFAKILFKYSMDVVANCVFGVDSKSWEMSLHQQSKFEECGKNLEFRLDAKSLLKLLCITITPKFADKLGLEILDYESSEYFAAVIKSVVKQRRESGERREDFLQLLMDAQDGILKMEDNQLDDQSSKVTFSDDDLVANALMFFLAGFETTQTVLLFTLYSLAVEQETQEKLYEHVKSVLEKYDGKLTYESLSEMTYLDWVLNETMRLYPAAARTERQCSKDYPIPGTQFVIRKGDLVAIPQQGIHNDTEYWTNPKTFMPERFSPEEKAARPQFTFMPFGNGPRSCIGMRFALLKIKTVVAHLVTAFRVEPCGKTDIPPQFTATAAVKPRNGMWLKVIARE